MAQTNPRHGQSKSYNKSRQNNGLQKISAPYNFVPLAKEVFYPEQTTWADLVNHDIPFNDGACGTLVLTLQSHTPLLIGSQAAEERTVKPFKLPDDTLSIPGSTTRGMIRNVLEIVSFGKMKFVDDKRYGIRDLYAKFYQKALTKNCGSKKFKPRTKTGWLNFSEKEGCWMMTPCKYYRIEQKMIRENLKPDPWVRNSDRSSAEQKYQVWLRKQKTMKVHFAAESGRFHSHSRGNRLFYSKVLDLGSGSLEGHLIFTGQPGPQKHMEFIFGDGDITKSSPVPAQIIRDFRHIYQGSKHYAYLKKANCFPEGIPVFYLEDDEGQITSMGLSQMYKLAYKKSVVQAMGEHASQMQSDKMDLAELIFGTVDEKDGKKSLKGRVNFSHAVHLDGELKTRRYQTILGGPKPTYYPNYILQDEQNGKLEKNVYKTFMDGEIRGWKRYPVCPPDKVMEPKLGAGQDKSKAWVKIHPVEADQKFQIKMRFHNLRKCELGALVYCLKWGGKDNLRHSIGMGKPFGFGQVSITIEPEKSEIIPNDLFVPFGKEEISNYLQEALTEFKVMMTNFDSQWENTPQLTQLFAMADPGQYPGLPGSTEYLVLGRGRGGNQFVVAKSSKPPLVLQSYVAAGAKQQQE